MRHKRYEMTTDDKKTDDAAELRRKPEDAVCENEAPSPEEKQMIIHELKVHQVELEMQNEELRAEQEKLVAARAHHSGFYNLAPVGYFTLSKDGAIIAINLIATTLLEMAREALINQPLTRFILNEDQDIFYLHHKQVLKTGEPKACELRMVKKDGTSFWTHLQSIAALDDHGAPVIRIVMSDITGSKQMEEELREKLEELRQAQGQIKTLRGILPICMHCKKIRDDAGHWNQLEVYIRDHTEANFSHSICPECLVTHYSDIKR
jgi:PAS domain S-box-containing protein